MARLRGAEVALVGLEADERRLQVAAAAYGCLRFRTGSEALRAWARERDGAGADGVVDASGHSAALREAMELVRPAGFITKVGWGPQPLGFSLDPIVQKAVRLQGSFSHNWPVWERVIALLGSGALDVAPLVGGLFPLREWKAAFEKMERGEIVKAAHHERVSSVRGRSGRRSPDLTTITEALEMARGSGRASTGWRRAHPSSSARASTR
jgi:alcohol dehydrogenase/L-iditol 2-dehydrogenase